MDVNELVNPKYYCIEGNVNFLFINDNNNWIHITNIDMYVDLVKVENKCKKRWRQNSFSKPHKRITPSHTRGPNIIGGILVWTWHQKEEWIINICKRCSYECKQIWMWGESWGWSKIDMFSLWTFKFMCMLHLAYTMNKVLGFY
jgi:hypothetical protein